MAWAYQIDISDIWDGVADGEIGPKAGGRDIANRIRETIPDTFLRGRSIFRSIGQPPTESGKEILAILEEASDKDDLENAMDMLWDWADDNRVWIGVI